MDDLVGKGFGLKASQASPAGAIGGGAIFKLSRYIGVEGGADYVLSHHNIVGGPGIDQNNFRASAGIVFTLGRNRAHQKEPSVPVPTLEGNAVGNGPGIAVMSLGVVILGSNRERKSSRYCQTVRRLCPGYIRTMSLIPFTESWYEHRWN
jgi:hypothetical protein